MSKPSPKHFAARKSLFVLLLVLIGAAIFYALLQNRPWHVPAEAKLRKNPLTSSAPVLEAIRPLYGNRCASCHGDSGKGDGHDASLYSPAPTDFTVGRQMSAVSDGELFYKLSEGRKPMPSFKKRLSEDQRWQLILLLRSFAAVPQAQPSSESSPGH